MAKQGISTGTTPNDGSGDSLLDGAVKINSNFDEVYAAIGNGSTVSTPVTSITAGDNITVSGSTGSVTITGIGTADIDTDRINVSGVVTASSFSGSGANLTNLPAAALTGTLPALDGSALTGVTASGVGVTVQDGGSGKGTASIINFGANLSVTTVNSGITTITAGAANTANLNSDTIVVGVLTATTFGSDLTLGAGRDVVFSSSSGINASTSTENLHWGSGNLYFNSGSPEINWLSGGGNIRVTGAASTISILGGNPAENMAVFKVGGAAELYYDNSKKFETTGSGTTTYGTALTQQIYVSGVSTFIGNVTFGNTVFLGDNDTMNFGSDNDLQFYHTGIHGYVVNNTGNLYLTGGTSGNVTIKTYNKDSLVANLNGSVDLYHNNSKKLETTEQGVGISGTITVSGQSLVSGVSTFTGNSNFGGNVTLTSGNLILSAGGISATASSQNLNWGSGNFYFNSGSPEIGWTLGNGTIRAVNASGIISIKGGNPAEDMGVFRAGGAAELYYDNSKKFETTGYGVTITGGVYASGISTFIGNVIIGRTANEGSGMLLNGNGDNGGEINFTGPDSTDSNSTYYANIRLNRSFGNFKGDLEFHTNGYTGVGGGVGDFIFYKRETSSGRAERMRLTGEAGNLTVTGSVQVGSGQSFGSSGASAAVYYGDGSDLADGKWTLGADGSSNYTFTGIGFTQTTNDPILYLARGRVYEFVNTMGAHPFEIRESAGGSAFDRGVTNNAVSNGTLRFEIPFDAPNTLYYQCTSHSGMGSTIVVYPNTI